MLMAGSPPHFATARQAHHVVPAAAVVLIYTVVAGGTQATAANVGGLSLGTIAAGLLAQSVQAPTRTPPAVCSSPRPQV